MYNKYNVYRSRSVQGSASEATFMCLLAAKDRTTKRIKSMYPDMDEGEIKAKLVAYTSGNLTENAIRIPWESDGVLMLYVIAHRTFTVSIDRPIELERREGRPTRLHAHAAAQSG